MHLNKLGVALDAKMHQNETMNETIQQFLAASSNGASFREMGRASGINHSTIRRQLTGEGDLTAPVVVAIARAYEADVIAALVASGFVTESEAKGYAAGSKLKDASDVQLAQEILRRASTGEATGILTEPMPTGELIVGGFGQNAVPTADDWIDDAGVIDYPGSDKVAASEGTLEADRQKAVDEDPDPAPEDE